MTIDVSKIEFVSVRNTKSNVELTNPEPKAPITYNFQFDTTSGIDVQGKLFRFILKVLIDAKSDEENLSFGRGEFSTEFRYKLSHFEEIITIDQDGTPAVPFALISMLAAISYSTMRGIILTRTQGTALHGVVLPIVDPKVLIATATEPVESE